MIRKTTCLVLLVSLFFNLKILTLLAGTITVSQDVSVSATVGGSQTSQVNGGGGGQLNGPIAIPQTSVRFSGDAYPDATVTLLENGTVATSVTADSKGLFDITLPEKYDGTILYSLEALDINNQKSLLINYPLVVTDGYLTYVSGIRFPPTISLDKVQVAVGGFLTVSGYSLPDTKLQIVIEGPGSQINKTFTLNSGDDGSYDITLPLMALLAGNYSTYIRYPDDTRISKLVSFIIGDSDVSSINTTLNLPGDCNADGQINLVDFSVMAYWYGKPNPPACVDVNHDGIVDLTDFSILAFYWTD
ncbi:MAG: dockerin type I domain-containing protein [Candidatus Pacebacteria bacterium]|nr:dockerin type I domain-containing protein [Candidatus Paceibacterota bacterium]